MSTLLVFLLLAVSVMSGATSPDLLVAIRNGDHAKVQALLRGGADVNSSDSEGTTALMHAVIESDARMMELLLEKGALVNAKNALDSTALMYAATNLAKTRLLIDRGADVKVRNKRGATPMSVAVTTFGSTPVLKLLSAKGAEAEDRLLTAPAAKGDLEALQFLLSLGVSAVDRTGAALAAAIAGRCEPCVRLLVEKGAPADAARPNGGSLLNDTVKRANPELAQYLLDRGASLQSTDRERFTLLMQAVLSAEPGAARDRMVAWLLSKGVDPNAMNDRGDTAYLLAARVGISSTLDLLAKAGAQRVKEEWPRAAEGAPSAEAAVKNVLPLLEASGDAVFKSRACVSCHNNSLPAMTVSLARKKGFAINEEQARKELGYAVATDMPFLEPMRTGSTIGGASDTVGYTLMGMAAAGHPADALTDAHIHYLSIFQFPDGAWRNTSYRPPSEYSPFTTTAVALRAIRLYPIPGRREEFDDRLARAKRWLLAAKAYSIEERSMQLNALADAGATLAERAPFVNALKAAQAGDGSWSVLPGIPGEAYATGEVLYALHMSGAVPTTDPAYRKGVEWLLRNQLADGSWFMPTRAVPVQPHTFESGFPHGWHQFASTGASSWAAMALLFTLPDKQAQAEGLPNPYAVVTNFFKLPQGRTIGSTAAIDIDRDGRSVWVFERCGGASQALACADSALAPLLEFNWSGVLMKSFGAGMFVSPHGIHVDRQGNVWVSDGNGKGSKGHQVVKFSPEGNVLMTLGRAGVAGDGPDTFNQPSDILVAPNGDVFVADGHGGMSNARIVKFSKDGKFIKAWGRKGSGPGEFDTPHNLAMDSAGRLFVADRGNSRIQIFGQDGTLLSEWKQFGRPSGIYIDRNDVLYAADTQSDERTNPGFRRGIRIGSVKDGKVTAFIPDPDPDGTGEGIAADAAGNVYGSLTAKQALKKYVKQ